MAKEKLAHKWVVFMSRFGGTNNILTPDVTLLQVLYYYAS